MTTALEADVEAIRRSIEVLRRLTERVPPDVRVTLTRAIASLTEHASHIQEGLEPLRPLNAARAGGEVSKLRAALESRDVLLSALAHELRGRLASVVGYSFTLRRHEALTDAERLEVLDRLEVSTGRMQRAVDDLLDLDLYRADALQMRKQALSLDEIVGAALAEAEIGDRSVRSDVAGVKVVADRARLIRLLRALVRGAALLGVGEIELRARHAGTAVEILARCAARVDRSNGSDEARLAIAVAGTIAELHGGHVTVDANDDDVVSLRATLPAGR